MNPRQEPEVGVARPSTAVAVTGARASSVADGKASDSATDVLAGSDCRYVAAHGSDATTLNLEMRMADVEGGIGCVATSSGIAALAGLLLNLLAPGDELMVVAGLLGSTAACIRALLARHGIGVHFADPDRTDDLRRALRPTTRAIFAESVGNPGLEIPDFWAIAELAQGHGIPFIVDNTATTPALFCPGEFGADLVIRASGTFSNGHGACLGGAVVDTGRFNWAAGPFPEVAVRVAQVGDFAFLAHLRAGLARGLGGVPTAWTSFLMLRELEVLAAHTRRRCENARYLAALLQAQCHVREVNHPSLETSPSYLRARQYLTDHGAALLTFRLGSEERAFRFLHALQQGRVSGDMESSHTKVIHPASTIARDEEWAGREDHSAPADMILMSVGVESFSTIADDVRQALERLGDET